ncbi:MAG TPA: hypothetical protein VEZ12_01415 [Herpetosiphonaceae bacterium]|nr:hypothetical protein [Herpetosiphonaceae bacterium]
MLAVAVEHHHSAGTHTPRLRETSIDRGGLPPISVVLDDNGTCAPRDICRSVARAVVDDDHVVDV